MTTVVAFKEDQLVPGDFPGKLAGGGSREVPYKDLYDIERTLLEAAPLDPDDFEREIARTESLSVRDRRLDRVRRAYSAGREAVRRLRHSAHALRRAIVADLPEDSFGLAAAAIEGLLLQGEGDLLAKRLADAVALRLGRSVGEREDLRAIAKRAYSVRSDYIHGAEYNGDEVLREKTIAVLKQLIRAELEIVAR